MILARLFKATGNVLFHCILEDLIAGIPLFASIACAVCGQNCLASICMVCSIALSVYLDTLNPSYQRDDYVHDSSDDPLQSPPNVQRDDLKCCGDVFFRDARGRRLLLRGVNVGGDSKCPTGCSTARAPSVRPSEPGKHSISFVGRPFPLDEAAEHFGRLQAYGLTLVRLVVTWEAVEHEGPGKYDFAYLQYLQELVQIGAEHNISFIIDAHQDVWSRYTGGDGAPRWTLETVGFDVDKLHESGAAFTHAGFVLEHGLDAALPEMIWPSNHHKLACGTMFTLFFGGRDFCPEFTVSDKKVNIQDYLQEHFIAAMTEVAFKLVDEPNVLGFETLNEPNMGMLGWKDLAKPSKYLLQGPSPTWFQSFQLGMGLATEVDHYEPSLVKSGRVVLNAAGAKAWRFGVQCLWAEMGVWGLQNGDPALLVPDFFRYRREGEALVEVRPVQDYFVPFAIEFKRRIRTITRVGAPEYVVFVNKPTDFESSAIATFPSATDLDLECSGIAWAPHWYDLVPIVTKSFRSWIGVARDQGFRSPIVLGNAALKQEYARQLRQLACEGMRIGDGVPTLIGELGCPFDLHVGDHTTDTLKNAQIAAMDTTLGAVERALLSCCIWNYSATNSDAHGDGWNGENFSIWTPGASKQHTVFAGGRALPAVIRPYAFRCPGTPVKMQFCIESKRFDFEYVADSDVDAELVVFLPRYHYHEKPDVVVSDGCYDVDLQAQTLRYRHSATQRLHTLVVTPAAQRVHFQSNQHGGDKKKTM
jgi:hypothetical protein